jgi:glutamine amidotransferase
MWFDETPRLLSVAEILKNKKPFFGICVGMQLLATTGLEHGEHEGLGWIDGVVKKLEPKNASLKIPHMGCNNLRVLTHDSRLTTLDSKDVYFVHSYHFVPDEDVVVATVDYGVEVAAAVAKGNIFGTQFHPEKSQAAGLQLIQNFINWQA